jgi:hypothetical protein
VPAGLGERPEADGGKGDRQVVLDGEQEFVDVDGEPAWRTTESLPSGRRRAEGRSEEPPPELGND